MNAKPLARYFRTGEGRVKRVFPLFSLILFLAIAAVSMVAYTISARQINRSFVEQQLAIASETIKLRLATAVTGELTLALKMADTPVIEAYFSNPSDSELERMAMEEFDNYQKNFKNGNLFWINDIDKIFYSTGNAPYVVDPAAPESYWYNMTLYETVLYNFNINYNPDLDQINLWVNLPVFADAEDGGKRPVGMLGTGIDLTDFSEFVSSAFKEFDAKITSYIFNDSNEITSAADYDLVFNKTLLPDHLGSAGAEIVKIAGMPAESNRHVFTFEGKVYLVSSIPEMNWHLAVSYPAPGLLALNPAMNAVYFGMLILILISLFAINVFTFRSDNALAAQNVRLTAANREAEAASQAKSAFLAKMSHEIRTPMNAITGMAELILREDISPAAREYALSVKQAGANLLVIINDILDFSKIESGKMEIIPAEYEFASLLNDVIAIIRMRVAEKPVRFVTDIDSALPWRMIGDETRIRQILLNVLTNAVKYTNEGRIILTVRGEPAGDGGIVLTYEVSDTGIGIKEEDMDRLFGNFEQFDARLHRGVEGTGLGLAITRSLCRAMGGDISVFSRYGEGSAFTVRIPQQVKDDAPFAAVENPESKCALVYETREIYANSVVCSIDKLGVSRTLASDRADFLRALEDGRMYSHIFVASFLFAEARGMIEEHRVDAVLVLMAEFGEVVTEKSARAVAMPVHSGSVANILNNKTEIANYSEGAWVSVRFVAPEARVLIVDDIATNLKVAAGLLAPYEMTVETAAGGAEAIRMAEKTAYDMIFMDHMMPDMDGVEAAATIRALEGDHYKAAPIIALTANAISGMKEMFAQNGFSDYLSKPIEPAGLDELIARWIPKEKQRRADKKPATEPVPRDAGLKIDGLDTKRGLIMTGGDAANYREVLALFCKDVAARMEFLQDAPDETALPLLVTQVHALKSASAGIGAAALSAEAAKLEDAGNRGDTATIAAGLVGFREMLAALTERIGAALSRENARTPETEASDLDKTALLLLKVALETEDMGQIDEILTKFGNQPESTDAGKTLSKVEELVLTYDFREAAAALDALLLGFAE